MKAELECFDIEATFADDETIHMNWLWSNALGGVKVRVAESDAEAALTVLAAEPEPDEEQGSV